MLKKIQPFGIHIMQIEAVDAHGELRPFMRYDEKQVAEVKVFALKKPAAILLAAVNHYRSYFKIDR